MNLTKNKIIGLVSAASLLLVGTIGYFSFSENIRAGYVGVLYDRTIQKGDTDAVEGYGGISKTPLTGFNWYFPVTQDITLYPVSLQTANFTGQEGGLGTITFGTAEGLNVPTEVTMSFSVQMDKAPYLYAKFGGQSIEMLTNGIVKSRARDVGNGITTKHSVEKLYGTGRGDLSIAIRDALRKDLEPYGINVEGFSLVNPLVPDNIKERIDEKVKAAQEVEIAKQALEKARITNQQAVEQTKREAEQARAAAEGRAQATIKEAEAAAKAKVLAADAEAQANKKISESITDNILRGRELDARIAAWNKISGQTQFVDLPNNGNNFFNVNGFVPTDKNK